MSLPALILALAATTAGPPMAVQQAVDAPVAQPPQAVADSLRVFLMTFGPGAAVWERFGHNALWIHDPEAGTDIAYHYGLFDMSEEGFMLKFLQGRMFYSMGAADANALVVSYRRVGRGTTVQELRLTREQARELQRFLEWNLRPENRVYRYDYFRDNCSTRIRDALDDALGGTLNRSLSDLPARLTYRSQAVALTAEDELLTTGMDLGLGPLADQRISHWELAFIPMRLRDDLRDLSVERDGVRVPLVAAERVVPALGADESLAEPPYQTSPPLRALRLLVVGLLLGTLLAGAGLAIRRATGAAATAARWTLALGGALWGLATGVLGLILLGLWTLTDHEFAWRNENLLQTDPLALVLVVLVPLAVLGHRTRAARWLATALAALSVLGLLIHPLPLTPQANLPIIGLALPIHLGLAWALWQLPSQPEP